MNIDYIFDRLKERSEECAIVSDAKEYSFGVINIKKRLVLLIVLVSSRVASLP